MPDARCPFCPPDPARLVAGNDLALALLDGFPVNPGHTLVVPRRHVPTWFDATPAERAAILALVDEVRARLDASDPRPDGYNIGINVGEAAGQTVPHLHVHVIPRYRGDVDDPTGGVRFVIPERGNYRRAGHIPRVPGAREPALVTGGSADPFLAHLGPLIGCATQVDILAAFIQHSGVHLVRPLLRSALARGARIRVLTGDYLHITQVEALRSLRGLEQAATVPEEEDDAPAPAGSLDLRVVELETLRAFACSFHPKCWVLRGPGGGVAFVGSSNLSRAALTDGVEWNLRLEEARDPAAFDELAGRWDEVWTRGREVDDAWLDAYADRAGRSPIPLPPGDEDEPIAAPRLPPLRDVQREALEALEKSRLEGRNRALIVMATGLGKTRVAVEDAVAFSAGRRPMLRVLVLAHRTELLDQASDAFEARVPGVRTSWFAGPHDDARGEVVLASVQKVHRNLDRFSPDTFAYVIVDEVHHADAPTYRAILRRLTPRFLLGLTATPERADAGDILGLFDDHIAYDADIGVGIALGHLVPFHYFGLPDTVDYRPIPWRNGRFDPSALSKAVQTHERMDTMWKGWEGHPGTRSLVFCCSVAHAGFVARWLGDRGLEVLSVHTGPESDDRSYALQRLDAGEVDAICAVDLYNEGVDIPHVDRVVMLRPTESPLLFLQQLGRGLRRPDKGEKASLTVLDFVGNHRVFLDRVRLLLNLAGTGPRQSVTELFAKAGTVDLPAGSSVDLELEAVDLLRRLLPSGDRHVLVRAYRELRVARGARPRIGEIYRMGYNPASLRGYAAWFDFVEAEGDLAVDERSVLDEAGAFLQALERGESMDKSFKMVTVQALIEAGALDTGMAVPELARRSHEILVRSPELVSDIEGVRDLPDPIRPSPEAWERYWRRNPVHFWTAGAGARRGRPWFRLDGDRFVPTFRVPAPLVPTLEAMTAEIVDYRLARYRRSRREESESPERPFTCRVIHNGQGPILKLPDRGRVPGIPTGDTDVRLPDGSAWRFRFVSIACNVAHPVGSQRNQLPDLLRRWFGPDAGRSGTDFQIRFQPSPDGWWVEPLPVDGGEVVPLSGRGRFVAFPSLRVAAGWAAAERTVDRVEPETVSLPGQPREDAFAVRASGSSMEGWRSEIRDGDWLVLRYARGLGIGAVEGRIALVRRGDPEESVVFHLKRVARTDGGYVLRSDNPDVVDRPVVPDDQVVAVLDRRARPEDLGPPEGTVLEESEIAAAFGLDEGPSGRVSRPCGHLFLRIEGEGSLAWPDRLERPVTDRRPGETAFVLAPEDGDRWRYLGVARWLEDEGAWAIPEVDWATWRALGPKGTRSASRRLDPRWATDASALVERVLAFTRPDEVHDVHGHPYRIVGPADQGGLRLAGPEGGFAERTVSLADLAWVLAARNHAHRLGIPLDEALVNRLRYLDGTPKASTRWIDTGWAMRIVRLWEGWRPANEKDGGGIEGPGKQRTTQ